MKNYLNATTVTLKQMRAFIYDAQSCTDYSLAVKTCPGTHCAVCFSPRNQGSSVQNASFVYVSFFLPCQNSALEAFQYIYLENMDAFCHNNYTQTLLL